DPAAPAGGGYELSRQHERAVSQLFTRGIQRVPNRRCVNPFDVHINQGWRPRPPAPAGALRHGTERPRAGGLARTAATDADVMSVSTRAQVVPSPPRQALPRAWTRESVHARDRSRVPRRGPCVSAIAPARPRAGG